MYILTHDGKFHADEVLATAVLMLVYGSDTKVIRSRNRDIVNMALQSKDWIVLDVGGEYNPKLGNFDHHQKNGAGFRDEECRYPYATAGLVWKQFGRSLLSDWIIETSDGEKHRLDYALDTEEIEKVFDLIDKRLFRDVDSVDCGIFQKSDQLTFSSLFSMMRAPEAFKRATALAKSVLEDLIAATAGPAVVAKTVREIAQRREHPNILVLEKGMAWKEVVAEELLEIRVVVVCNDGRWNVQIANDSKGVRRSDFPKHWLGLEEKELAAASGIHDAVFCHRSGFIAGARTRESAIRMAMMALEA